MLAVQRRIAAIDLLERSDALSVEHLAAQLHVSLSTVRRDLDELEREGLVRRVHGGAVRARGPAGSDAPELPPSDREVERPADKLAIARMAATLIADHSTILVTGGTTTTALLPLLAGIPGITVVTNSVDVAHRLSTVDVDVIVLGGALRRPESSLVGHLVGLVLNEVHIDHVLMGAYGVDPRRGILGASAQECETDRAIAGSAERLTVLADASKFTRRSPHRIAPVERLTELVTSQDAPRVDVDDLRERGVTVHVT